MATAEKLVEQAKVHLEPGETATARLAGERQV